METVLKKNTNRNYGIDLLRIVSMIMIVTLHVLKQGGILDTVEQDTLSYNAAWVGEALCIGAVNLYAMISGFVGVNSTKARFYKLASMWLQVEFYCIISTILIYSINKEPFDFAVLINRLSPVSTNIYWYFSAYFIMFFFTPLFNKLLSVLNKRQLKYFGTIVFIFSSLWPTIWQADMMYIKRGYTFLWLCLLYILGATVKKLELHKKVNRAVMITIFVLMMLLGAGFKFLAEEFEWPVADNNMLISYTASNVVVGTFCLFLAAAKTEIKAKVPVKIIKTLSPLTFGVYIIHTSEYPWNYLLAKAFVDFSEMRALYMIAYVILAVLGIYLACSAIDAVRLGLFKLLRIDQFTSFLEEKIRSAISKAAMKKERAGRLNEH